MLEDRFLLNAHPAGETPHHIHADVSIFVNGQNFIIPPGVNFPQSHAPEFPPPGVPSTVALGVNGTDENAHTHTDDGILHLDEGQQLGTGTVSNTAGSATVTGTGTSFTTELKVGDFIQIGTTSDQIVEIAAIADNTHLTTRNPITAAHSNNAFGISFFVSLNDFFTNWGAVFSQSQLRLPTAYGSDGHPTAFSNNVTDSTHTIKFFVNGAASTDFQNYEPEDGDQIVISYETIPTTNIPTLNPIHNVTVPSNPGASAPSRTIFVPLDGSDPNNFALTYSASSSNPSITATVEPSTNRFLRLNVSGKDIEGSNFTGDLTFQLLDDVALNTANNIVSLVQSGFYNNNFVATLNAAQEVPPTSSTARGTATLAFHPGTNTFDIDVRVQGITLAQLTQSHIHSAAPGVDGPIIFDLGGASQWVTDGTGIRRTIQGASLSSADAAALMSGNTYVNIHTVANSDGEIRGQLTHIPFHRIINDFMAQGGSRTGDGLGDTTVADFDDEFSTDATFTGFGQLAMANGGDDTNDTQFFVTDSNLSYVFDASSANEDPPSRLNFQHTIFGQLVSGFDVFNKIMLTPVHLNPNGSDPQPSAPDSPVTINSAALVADTQHAVLRLTVPANLPPSGTATNSTITVTARNSANQTAQRSFLTNVIADSLNDRPFLGAIAAPTTRVNTAVTIPLPATDLESDSLTFVIRDASNFANQPTNVSVSIDQTAHQATLTPANGFTGTVDMLVGVRDATRRVDTNGDGQINSSDNIDARGNFDTQRIRLTVTDANIAPTANPQTVHFQLNTAATFQLSGDDGDPGVNQTLTFIIDTLPATGTLRDSGGNPIAAGAMLTNPSLTYTPNTGSTAADSFTFHVKDSGGTANGGQDTSTPPVAVTLSLQVNQSPTASPQTLNYQSGTPLTVQLTGSDGDPDVNQTLTFFVDTLPAHGTLKDSNGTAITVGTALPSAAVTFTPEAGFTGNVQFDFHVRDSGGTTGGGDDTSDTARISLRGPGDVGPPAPEPTLHDHVLRIQGTKDDDVVTVELNDAADMIEVVVNGAAPSEFAVADVNLIRIRCRAGDDEVTVSEDIVIRAKIMGGQGADSLTGGGGDDVIRGRRGDDVIDGGSGDDKLFGGRGADNISGGAGADVIWGRRGGDTIDGGDDNDKIHGGPGSDNIDGGAGTDTAHGGGGNDTFTNVENEHQGNNDSAVAAAVRERNLNDSAIAALTAERFLDDAQSSSTNADPRRAPESAMRSDLVDAVLNNI